MLIEVWLTSTTKTGEGVTYHGGVSRMSHSSKFSQDPAPFLAENSCTPWAISKSLFCFELRVLPMTPERLTDQIWLQNSNAITVELMLGCQTPNELSTVSSGSLFPITGASRCSRQRHGGPPPSPATAKASAALGSPVSLLNRLRGRSVLRFWFAGRLPNLIHVGQNLTGIAQRQYTGRDSPRRERQIP